MRKIALAAVSTGAALLLTGGLAVPALAATTSTQAPVAKTHATVTVDTAKDSATVVTPKRGTFTISWRAVSPKRDLVTVKNSKDKVVHVRLVSQKQLKHAEAMAAKHHYAGILRLWHGARQHKH